MKAYDAANRTHWRVGKTLCKIGRTISDPYFVCAARMRACRWVASKMGEFVGFSQSRFDISFATWFGERSAWSKEGCWQRASTAFSNSMRTTLTACIVSSLLVGADTMDDASTSRSRGLSPHRSTNRGKSKLRKESPSPLSTPSLNLSARKGSRERRCTSCTRSRKVRLGDASNEAGEAVEESLLFE